MGWSNGAQIMDEVWTEVVPFIPKKEQEDLAMKLVKIFEDEDADTIGSESEYPILRKASRAMNHHPHDDEDDGDED